MTQDVGAVAKAPVVATGPSRKGPGEGRWIAGVFLAPAGIFLAAIVLYPLVYTLVRSFFHDGTTGQATSFAGLANYTHIFTQSDALQALKNNVIWVVVVPVLVTILGLIFAVLTEKIRWASAFKVVLFMPMAISFLASGVTWTLIYADQPSRGLGNAVAIGIHDTFNPQTSYPELHPVGNAVLTGSGTAGYRSAATFAVGSPALVPLAGLNLVAPPKAAQPAVQPSSGSGLRGVVWNDFKLGGGGKAGVIDQGELGIPGLKIEAVKGGKTVATATTQANGTFAFPSLTAGDYTLALPKDDFSAAYGGIAWLGKNLITPSIIVAYLWIYAGFAMVLLAAGMAAIPRDALEAARMDGATEWQVFRKVTAPLLTPVLLVVFVTMVINVLKIFDIVFIIQQSAGGNAKYANVLAVQLYTDYGNQQFGAASAVGIVLVILVLPAMVFQVRNFRRESR
ncbi:MAG: transporter permease subunit [Marmoricola sp.]|nr:transporter permease subunit [Marmoricola sp.]